MIPASLGINCLQILPVHVPVLCFPAAGQVGDWCSGLEAPARSEERLFRAMYSMGSGGFGVGELGEGGGKYF